MVEGLIETEIVKDIELETSTPQIHEPLIKEIAPFNDIDEEQYLKGYALDIAQDSSKCLYMGKLKENPDRSKPIRENFEYTEEGSLEAEEKFKSKLGWLLDSGYLPQDLSTEIQKFAKEFVEKFKDRSDLQANWQHIRNLWIGRVKPIIREKCDNGETKKDYRYFEEKKDEILLKNENEGLRVPKGILNK